MKKFFALPLFIFAFTVCAAGHEVSFSLDANALIDGLWTAYFNGADENALDKILEYVNTPDELTLSINQNYDAVSSDREFMDILTGFGATFKNGKIEIPFDLEILAGFLFRDQTTAGDADYVYSYMSSLCTEDLKTRAVVKMNAFWSVVVNAQKSQPVFLELKKRLPLLMPSIQYHFKSYLDIESIAPYAESSNGRASFSDGKTKVEIFLTDSLQDTMAAWTVQEGQKKFSVSCVSSAPGESIAPFVIYSAEDASAFPLFYDIALIDDAQKLVPLYRSCGLVLSYDEPESKGGFYSAKNCEEIFFSGEQKKGEYAVRVTVYSPWSSLGVFDLWFTR